MSSAPDKSPAESIITVSQQWLDRMVIGLNLCPFARPVREQQRIGWQVSQARSAAELAEDLWHALDELARSPRERCETLILIHPWVLNDFEDYNDFLGLADELLDEAGHWGTLQIASFHPDYCFADSPPDDPANYSNRSPYPMLHLLREDSIAETGISEAQSAALSRRNIDRLRHLGLQGIQARLEHDEIRFVSNPNQQDTP